MHIGHNFTGDTIYTYPLLSNGNDGMTTVDMWGEKGKDFSVQIDIYSNNLQQYVYSSEFFSTSINDNDDTTISVGPNSAEISFAGESSCALNQKSHFLLEYNLNNSDYEIYVNVTSNSGMVHMWNNTDNAGGDFSVTDALGFPLPGYTEGDNTHTAGEIGATANDIIAVGAYTSKNSFTALNSNVTTTTETNGDLADFSSRGPTVDGRIKPDITAPGNYVVAAMNSFSPKVLPGGDREDELVASTVVGGKTYYYGGMQGTSMATPVTAGAVALLLSLDPTLTPERVKKALGDNAIKDGFTGSIPAIGNNSWGMGKLDVQASMLSLEGQVALVNPRNVINSGLSAFPNPTNSTLNISAENSISAVRIIDISGKVMFVDMENASTEKVIDVQSLNSGVYLLEVITSNGTDVVRIVKN